MHCASCAMNIDFDLEDIPGILESKTHYAQQKAEVTFDDQKVTVEQICDQISKTGYRAVVAK